MNLFSLRALGRRLVPKPAHAFVRRRIHHAGLFTWETKEYEVWLIIQYLLYLLQPRKMIEFGSGRSTDYLAEYADKSGAEFISIEESASFARKINRGLALTMRALRRPIRGLHGPTRVAFWPGSRAHLGNPGW